MHLRVRRPSRGPASVGLAAQASVNNKEPLVNPYSGKDLQEVLYYLFLAGAANPPYGPRFVPLCR